MIDKVRQIALKVLYEINEKQAYSNIALDSAIKQMRKESNEFYDKDISFISEIVYGTTSWRLTIDEIIKKHSNIRLKKISPWILNILRMSIYQILFLDKVPKSAAVNEGVNLAKRYGHQASSNFVNAILRKVDKQDYETFFANEDDVERISLTTSMPKWLVEALLKQNERKVVEKICQDSNKKPNVHIRVNSLKIDKETLKRDLQEQGIQAQEGEVEDFLILDKAKNLESKKEFREGKFTVQDEVAGFIPLFLNPKPNQRVLDACSSPGGKTTYMAELMQNQGEILAWDLHEHRIKLVEQVASRLGITIIQTEVKDATKWEEKYMETFDKILLDVPCLGIGVLKRKPDIKWKRKQEDIEEMTKIQLEILQTCSTYLKKGGELVYSTCSILKEENQDVIEKFLTKNPNFRIEKIEKEGKGFLTKFVENRKFIQVYPNEKSDGFFMCKICKA
ncbi:MAG: 16S rRNA (cytosine(967)-C(5))-methyltransferase RsmB [Clostridia bacterium]|nr:16S rRNA (cytosine(967)-C(5))-methyltransferase RsmB [Clostridia bacterium]